MTPARDQRHQDLFFRATEIDAAGVAALIAKHLPDGDTVEDGHAAFDALMAEVASLVAKRTQ